MSVSRKISGIYGLRCIHTNKWYVGQSIDIYDRWTKAYQRLNCKCQPKIYNAIVKYGYDAFEKVIIEECDTVDWILDYRETYWIRTLNSISNGYNLREGGHSGKMSDDIKKKIAAARRGKSLSDETKRKISVMNRQVQSSAEYKEKISKSWIRRRIVGVSEETRQKLRLSKSHISDETRQKISAANRNRTQSVETRQKIATARKLYWERKNLTEV